MYTYGCYTCGVNGVSFRRLKAYCSHNNISLDVKNSNYDEAFEVEHIQHLVSIDARVDTLQAVIVDGENVLLLREWQP